MGTVIGMNLIDEPIEEVTELAEEVTEPTEEVAEVKEEKPARKTRGKAK